MSSKDKTAEAFRLGAEAFHEGYKRVPSTYIARKGLKYDDLGDVGAWLKAWLKGWDHENLAQPVEGWTDEENDALQRARGTH